MTTKTSPGLALTLVMSFILATHAKPYHSMAMANNVITHSNDSTPAESIIAISKSVLPQKLVTNFKRNFRAATNSKWTRSNTTFFVNFNMDGNTAMATFNTKGRLNYGLIYKNKRDLPPAIQQMIYKNYASFSILSVTEIRIPGMINYKVILADTKQYIDLRLTQDGQIQQAKQVNMPS